MLANDLAKAIANLWSPVAISVGRLRRKLLYQWRDRFRAEGKAGFERPVGRPAGSTSKAPGPPPVSQAELRIAELRVSWTDGTGTFPKPILATVLGLPPHPDVTIRSSQVLAASKMNPILTPGD